MEWDYGQRLTYTPSRQTMGLAYEFNLSKCFSRRAILRRWKHFAAISDLGCWTLSRNGASISFVRLALSRADSRPTRASCCRRRANSWARLESCPDDELRTGGVATTAFSLLPDQKLNAASINVETAANGQNTTPTKARPGDRTNGRPREIESTPNGAPTAKYITKALSRFTLRIMKG
jgi:hypothetical protein